MLVKLEGECMTCKIMELTVTVGLLKDRLENNGWEGRYENS